MLETLLKNGANPYLLTKNNKKAVDLATDPKVYSFFKSDAIVHWIVEDIQVQEAVHRQEEGIRFRGEYKIVESGGGRKEGRRQPEWRWGSSLYVSFYHVLLLVIKRKRVFRHINSMSIGCINGDS